MARVENAGIRVDEDAAIFPARHGRLLRIISILLVIMSLSASLVLLTKHTHLGGPGDELGYYDQAAHLLPFTDHFYGPGYFVGLRVVHDVFRVEWFTAGRILSWLSACVFVYLCHLLFRRLLAAPLNWLALGLVAANPTLVTESFGSGTLVYGAMWVVAAIVATLYLDKKAPKFWILAGILFAIAFLTRFQALGFLMGASFGVLLRIHTPISKRLLTLGALVLGFIIPVSGWYGLLQWRQGYIPANYNFVHLTHALGTFDYHVDDIISKYGNMWGVLRSPGAVKAITAETVKETLKFPFTTGFELLFICAGWLIPGLVVTASRREAWAPWFFAFVCGLVVTGLGIGALGWTWYYIPVLPFAAILISNSVEALARSSTAIVATLQAAVILASTALWSPPLVLQSFYRGDWPEWSVARDYLQSHAKPTDVVSSTAASLPYGATFKFIDRDDLIRPGQESELLERLRSHGVTYLVLTERHGYSQFPALQYLLDKDLPDLPAGFARELYITEPRRVAIYSISATGQPGKQ
jgi:hypothetical protein